MKRRTGFTLVELLVVIAIMAVLAVGLVVAINPAGQIAKARDVSRKTGLLQIKKSLDSYYLLHGKYPATTGWVNSASGANWIPGIIESGDAKKLPADPVNKQTGGLPWSSSQNFAYFYRSDDYYNGDGGPDCDASPSSSYLLTARLENTSDPQVTNTVLIGNGGLGCEFVQTGLISLDPKTELARVVGTPGGAQPTSAPTTAPTSAPTLPPVLPTVPQPTAPPAYNDKIFGFAAGCCTPAGVTLEGQLDGQKALGSQGIRFDFPWIGSEPAAPNGSTHTYVWPMDAMVSTAHSKGLHILAVVGGTPQWAASPTCWVTGTWTCAPTDMNQFGAFVGALVERYDADGNQDAPGSPRVAAWEIWNEPNLTRFWASGDAALYTQLLIKAYDAAHAADPTAIVLSAGLAPSGGANAPIEYLKRMYTAGAAGKFDVLGFHPYAHPGKPSTDLHWSAWKQMFKSYPADGQPDNIRSVMTANGDAAKKIWATEYGAPTHGDSNGDGQVNCYDSGPSVQDICVSEGYQASIVQEALTLWNSYPWAGAIFWYQYQDINTNSLDTEDNFGLLRSDGTLKPAANTLKSILVGP